MKHLPMLMLSLATLILSYASAASAKESRTGELLTFNPTPVNRSVPDAKVSDATLPNASETAKPAIDPAIDPSKDSSKDPSESVEQPFHLPDLPLFELPPFQSEQSDANSDSAASSDQFQEYAAQPDSPSPNSQPSTAAANSNYSSDYSSKPDTSVAPVSSPFQLPDHLSDTDLFESDSGQAVETQNVETQAAETQNIKTESNRSHTTSQTDSEVEFEKIPDAVPSRDLSEVNQPSQQRYPIEKNTGSSVASSSVVSQSPRSSSTVKSIGLSFDPPIYTKSSPSISQSVTSSTPIASSASRKSEPVAGDDGSIDRIFKGDSDSLVAVAVGSAEGTRTADGGKNSAYQGHTDPGNGAWNLGSFSYQHGASSPEEADVKQLARLRNQAQTILDKAATKGLDLSLAEKLNGIDLANQAPKAALDEFGGYIDWLADARASGLGGNDAILWARVHSFLDPYTQTWNAPGLGNSEDRITRDQERRMLAIAKAIATYVQDLSNHP